MIWYNRLSSMLEVSLGAIGHTAERVKLASGGRHPSTCQTDLSKLRIYVYIQVHNVILPYTFLIKLIMKQNNYFSLGAGVFIYMLNKS